MADAKVCSTCRHYQPRQMSAFGGCKRWAMGYDVMDSDLAPDEVVVESDEGWGMAVGPQFGCVLWEAKADG